MRCKFILLLSATGLFATCHKQDSPENGLLIDSSFEGSNPLRGWENDQHCCDYSVVQSSDHFTNGSHALRLDIKDTDERTSGSIRSELVQDNDDEGAERWYGFNMYLQNWEEDDAGEHVFQWHPASHSEPARASLWTSGGRYQFVTNPDGGANDYTDLGPVLSDQWVAWVVHIKWAENNNGILQVWKNGKLVIDRHHIVTTSTPGNYFKLGINKFGWGSQPSTVHERVLFFDEVKIGRADAGYEAVRPR
jgi:hypothetical protein